MGEKAQWLRACVVLAEEPSSILSTHMRQLTTACNSNFRYLVSSDRPPPPEAYTDTCVHRNNKNNRHGQNALHVHYKSSQRGTGGSSIRKSLARKHEGLSLIHLELTCKARASVLGNSWEEPGGFLSPCVELSIQIGEPRSQKTTQ